MRAALTADRAEILRAVKLIAQPGGVHEIRALQTEGLGPTASGYFNSPQPLVEAAANVIAEGVYVTLNPIKPALLARSKNALKRFARHTTSDTDIVSRRWFPIDLDPVRPSGISSTNEEHQAALERAGQVRDFLTERGWPAPIPADSGNGGHLLYRIAEPNDADTAALMRRVLEALDSEFSDETVAVDRTTYNAARIWKLYGTMARKGDSTPDRPHRLARIFEALDEPGIVTRELLEQIAALLSEPEPRANTYRARDQFNLENFIAQHGIPIRRRSTWSSGERWVLERCVFDPNHTGSSAAILRMTSGAMVYRCLHNGCVGRAWRDVRQLYEPNYAGPTQPGPERASGQGPCDEWGAVDFAVLNESRRAAPRLPVKVFGSQWERWINEVSISKSAPDDYVATSLLCAASSLIGNARRASPWPDWGEPVHLWIAQVGLPSSGKSPAQDAVLGNVRTLESEAARGYADTLREWETRKALAKARREVWEEEVRAAAKDGGEAPTLPSEAVEPLRPERPRLITNDTTPEAIASLLSAAPRGLMLFRDELAGWIGSFDRYSRGSAERGFWIETYGGRPYVIDRKQQKGEPISIPYLSVAILGGIQPDRLGSLLLEGEDDGLSARLMYT